MKFPTWFYVLEQIRLRAADVSVPRLRIGRLPLFVVAFVVWMRFVMEISPDALCIILTVMLIGSLLADRP